MPKVEIVAIGRKSVLSLSDRLVSQSSAGIRSCHTRCPRDPNFFRSLLLSGLILGLSSETGLMVSLSHPLLTPVESPTDQREKWRSRKRGLGSGTRADNGRFFSASSKNSAWGRFNSFSARIGVGRGVPNSKPAPLPAWKKDIFPRGA